jgi:hypothetical protein
MAEAGGQTLDSATPALGKLPITPKGFLFSVNQTLRRK